MKNKNKIEVWKIVDVKNWEEFVEQINFIGTREWIFRGQGNAEWEIESSITRTIGDIVGLLKLNNKEKHDKINSIESQALDIFKSQIHLYLSNIGNELEKLEYISIMQHHGAPTRLIDWTYSPYIASFFATETTNVDCAIYALNAKRMKELTDIKVIKADDSNKDIRDLDYKSLIFKNVIEPFFITYEPNYKNERIARQQGLFLVPSTVEPTIDRILEFYNMKNGTIEGNSEVIAYKFIIKKEAIIEFLKNLQRVNIVHEVIYPGIDGFCKSLKYKLLMPEVDYLIK